MPANFPENNEPGLARAVRMGAPEMKGPMIPTVHLNGTSRAELLRQLTTAAEAARTLIEALNEAMPNGRDYYPQGDDAIQQARREHAVRIDAVRNIKIDLMAIAEAL